jgi:hypothetical protein
MDLRQKHICDQIMNSITTADGQTKFGLSGLATLFNGKASDAEVAEAVQYLLDNNYLRRMQGRGVVGIGDSTDLQDYDLSHFDAFSKLPEKLTKSESTGSAEAYKGQQVAGKRPSLSEVATKPKPAASADNDQSYNTEDDGDKTSLKLETGKPVSMADIPTLFGIEKQAREQDEGKGIFEAIDALKKQLNPEPASDVALKLAVLSELSETLDPSISLVLKDIQADYRNRAI